MSAGHIKIALLDDARGHDIGNRRYLGLSKAVWQEIFSQLEKKKARRKYLSNKGGRRGKIGSLEGWDYRVWLV
ncbi:uncharacterized protein LAJ45_06594 [Morchella importuna]|uniref:uncharacterized protein n=1 Tax=Morchella importuna TaxID=1174673 RepID=UPI001E8ED584|nr:uncharacterized protein LAJ45_06594 [Morchella importuna]KAH8149514.1 hypothetical protein LAJ45_06594 [Morchella importuna]